MHEFLLRRALLDTVNSSSSSSEVVCDIATQDYTQSFDLSTVDPATNGFGFTIAGSTAGSFGYGVGGAGDFNGDGINDILFSQRGYGGNLGRAYVIFGKDDSGADIDTTGMSATDGITVTGGANFDLGAQAGSVDFAGDVNGDGFDDLILGSYNYNAGNGGATLVFGSASPTSLTLPVATTSEGVFFTGSNANSYMGYDVSGLGDINGDGFDDFAMSSPDVANSTYVAFGRSSFSTTPVADNTLSGADGFVITNANGRSIDALGDLNGDGIGDMLVTSGGNGYVIYGVAGTRSNVDVTALGGDGYQITGLDSSFGYSGAGGSDFNGDGTPDFAIGTTLYNSDAGETTLLFGDVGALSIGALTTSEGFRMGGSAAFEYSASFLSLNGDVNGDGYDDLLIGAAQADHSAGNSGSATLIFGRADTPTGTDLSTYTGGSTGIRIDGAAAGNGLGSALGMSDINGDGCTDLILGTASADKVYVIFGGQKQ